MLVSFLEPYLDADGALIPADAWRSFVDGSAQVPVVSGGNRGPLIQELQEMLEAAVEKRATHASHARIGVLFSGGIDSVLIAFLLQRLGRDFLCLTVGFQDDGAKAPEDVVESARIAKLLGFEQEIITFNMETIEELFRKTARILGKPLVDVVNIGVGAVAVAALEHGKHLGITHFFTGLGAEELFAGYDRHERAWKTGGNEGLHAECLRGLKEDLYARDLRRDTAIANRYGVTVSTPFLDERLMRFALALPPELKINETKTFAGRDRGDVPLKRPYKKFILREAAELLGLSPSIAWRPKRAAQYGSRTNNALTKLRKKAGSRDKDAYLASLQ